MNRWLIFFVLCSGNITAQSIRARVIDADSGIPILNAQVKVLNTSRATLTDSKGQFELKELPANTRLVLSASGYAPVDYLTSDTTTVITMERSATFLNNNIVVTARRFEENQFDVSDAVTVINAQELQQSLPRSTPEALMGSTGVWVQKTNHGGGSPIIRGLMGNQILLMVDGIRVNNAAYRYGPNQYMATIDPGLIERMEVSRGNGSVLYGSDALGGVVQILSKTPHFQSGSNHLHGSVNTSLMTQGMKKSARAELQWSDEKVAALGGFSASNFGDLVAGGSLGTLSPSGYREMAGDAKVVVRTGTQSIFTTALQHHQQEKVPRYDQVQQGGYSLYNFDPQIRQLGYVRWETSSPHRLVRWLRLTSALNRSVEETKSQKSGSPQFKEQKDIVNTYSATAEFHSIFTGSWQAQSGVEWYHDKVDSKATVFDYSTLEQTDVRGSYADGATSTSLAAYSTHTLDIKRLTASAGARANMVMLNVNDATFGNQKISPNAWVGAVGLAYRIHKNYRLIASANSGFRAPNVDDISKFGAVESTVFEIPSGSLSPERSRSIEVGVKATTKIFFGSLTAYATRLTDLIERRPSSYEGRDTVENRRVYQKQNVSESSLRGVEAEGEVRISSHLSLYGNMTYTYGENNSKKEPMRRIPPLFGKISLRYQHTSGLWARMDYIAAGDQTRLAPGDLSDARISVRLINGVMPGWDIFNVYAGYTYKFVSLSLAGQNLLNKAYRIYASGVDGYGRSLTLALTAKF